jgi:hypothetical protein
LHANPLFQLLTARSVIVGSLIWVGVTLVVSANMVANMVIAYPAAPLWARREALLFYIVMALVLDMDGWNVMRLHLLAR